MAATAVIIPVATPSARTATQTYIARWWQSNPVASWNDVARHLIERNGLDAMESARLLAMQNLAAADAAINVSNDKYHFSFWRPFQAIRRAAEDGNAATSPDPPGTLPWTPLLSAPYPSLRRSGESELNGLDSGPGVPARGHRLPLSIRMPPWNSASPAFG
jgi:hypothetical protein